MALLFLGIFIRMESMQGIGAGVLAQWKRSVRFLGTAGDLCLDFSFFFFPITFYVSRLSDIMLEVPMPPGLQRNGLLPPTE